MRHLATIQKISNVLAIEGAESIEKVQVKDWWCVAKKGEFRIGDFCVYFEIDSLLPSSNPLFHFLAKGTKEKKMTVDGRDYIGYRLKTIKLRGQISQGLALPVNPLLSGIDIFSDRNLNVEGCDVSEFLGVVKYEAPIPASLQGKVKGQFPGFIPKTDEERIQNMGHILGGFYVTEKLDGASVTYFKKDDVFGVCSRNLELEDAEGNTQWRLAREMNLIEKLPDNFAIQGELIGEGIQGNPLNILGQKVFFFNAYNIKSGSYLSFKHLREFIMGLNLNIVPIIDTQFTLPKNVEEMLEYAEGMSELNPNVEREGVVVRPKIEMMLNDQRFSFKAISNKYLLNEK